jgi:hypothetical protein
MHRELFVSFYRRKTLNTKISKKFTYVVLKSIYLIPYLLQPMMVILILSPTDPPNERSDISNPSQTKRVTDAQNPRTTFCRLFRPAQARNRKLIRPFPDDDTASSFAGLYSQK